jgi:K+-transporting ATPase A subunit
MTTPDLAFNTAVSFMSNMNFGALTFVPALSLGPIVEHFFMLSGKLF